MNPVARFIRILGHYPGWDRLAGSLAKATISEMEALEFERFAGQMLDEQVRLRAENAKLRHQLEFAEKLLGDRKPW